MKPRSCAAYLSFSVISAALLPIAALADTWQLAGHEVALEEVTDEGYRLIADGKTVMEDYQIFADQAVELPGGALILGSAGPGGNACNAAPFVLWLPTGGDARLDGPAETCAYMEPVVEGETVRWQSDASPGAESETWVWTAAAGLQAGEGEAFAPVPGLGWEAVAMLAERHPAEALRIEPVYNEFKSALGDQFAEFSERMSGLGSGGLIGNDYFGESCIKIVCETDFAGIWLDAAQRKAFAYMAASDGAEIVLFPADRALWPAEALARVDQRGK